MRRVADLSARWARDESGQVVVLAAAAAVALLGAVALAVDLGMAYVARAEAQRTADAAALAGTTALITTPGNLDRARRIATETAAMNTIRGQAVQLRPEDVAVTDTSVHVWARRLTARGEGVPTLFARVLGVSALNVSAEARSAVFGAGSATCLKPFIVPDLWDDANANSRYDAGELYGPQVTGYGTDFRRDGYVRDLGRPITLYPGSTGQALVPSWYFLMRMPGNEGGSDIRATIASTSCNRTVFTAGEERQVDQETGLKAGPVRQGVQDLISGDPNAYWDAATQSVRGSIHGDSWRASPRVITIALFDPRQPVEPGTRPVRIVNFATVFLETTAGSDRIIGRFLPAVGLGGSTDCGQTGTCAPFASHARITS